MEEEGITLTTAKLLKEKGFDYYCRWSYYKGHLTCETPGFPLPDGRTSSDKYMSAERYYAPGQSVLQRWLREVHKIHLTVIHRNDAVDKTQSYDWLIEGEKVIYRHFKTWEEALEKGLQKALTLI